MVRNLDKLLLFMFSFGTCSLSLDVSLYCVCETFALICLALTFVLNEDFTLPLVESGSEL